MTGVTSSPSQGNFVPKFLTSSGFDRVAEKMRVFQLHLVLALPGKLWSALGTPSNFYDRDSALLKPFDFPIYDLDWFLHKV